MPDRTGPFAPAELERVAAHAARAAAAVVAAAGGHLLRELLAAATPRAGLVDGRAAATAPTAALQWVVAPLDGAADRDDDPPRTVSVAAAVDGAVVAGAVVDVQQAEWFSAHRGGGARRGGQPIAVSSRVVLADAVVAAGREGAASAALELCWVGCGRLDGCYERGVLVGGYAAGALVAEEAGAVVELPCPENDDLLIAAAPGIFDALRAVAEPPAARSPD